MRPTLRVLLCACTLALPGCGYTVGSPFQAEIRSIYVPTFTSKSFRRNVEFQLTEAVQNEIQQRTPFRLVKEADADTQLTGRILDVRKNVLTETRFDDARELQISFIVQVVWEDLRSGKVLAQQDFALTPAEVQFISQADYAPEVGQSLATAYQQAVTRMARDIVNMMEAPW